MSILAKLTAIRQGPGSFHEKAQRLMQILEAAGATDIILITCDVCEEDLHPEHSEIFQELCAELDSKTQMDEIIRRLDGQTRPEAFVRVEAQTSSGCLTFCFFCDSTMCGNEVEYPENPDWDSLQKERAVRCVSTHPEWNAVGIRMSGSTRHRVVFDLILAAGAKTDFHTGSFESRVVQVGLTPEDDQLFQLEPRLKEMYTTLET